MERKTFRFSTGEFLRQPVNTLHGISYGYGFATTNNPKIAMTIDGKKDLDFLTYLDGKIVTLKMEVIDDE